MNFRAVLAVVCGALAIGITPDESVNPATWTAENLVVPDGPKQGSKWDPSESPFAVEILEQLGPDSPHNEIAVIKPAQIGASIFGVGWLGSIIDKTPAMAMLVQPTLPAANDFNRDKLTPAIEATPALKRKVIKRGSTKRNKSYSGGRLIVTGANSPSDLSSRTIKYLMLDEVDRYPDEVGGQGDLCDLARARQTSFHATGDWKTLVLSTPTIKDASRIEALYLAGDQRRWHVCCPECGHEQVLVFGGKDDPFGLKFDKTFPHRSYYLCASGNGCRIEHHHKRRMVQAGRWIATNPEGRNPSYRIDGLLSLFKPWDKIAAEFLAAKDDPKKLKAFVNLVLGEVWEERGDAPEWERLFARREIFPARRMPPGGLITTTAVDVQKEGFYYETVTWGRDKQSWSIDIGYLEGETADPSNPVWARLDEVYERRFADAYGNTWTADIFGVDAGFNSNNVYLWTRKKPKAVALRGEDGWFRPAISSTPSDVDVDLRGKKIRRGAKLWFVGTWPLKAEFYAYLRKDGRKDGAETDPPGFCHFSEQIHDERYFKQVTAEYLGEETIRGRTVRKWTPTGPNHFHDCRIYNIALGEHLGVGKMTVGEWNAWEALRGRPKKSAQGDLLDAMNGQPETPQDGDTPQATETKTPAAKKKAKSAPRRRKGGFVKNW